MVPVFVLWLVWAQDPTVAPPPPARRVEVSPAWELRWDEYRYRFENDSSFGTAQLVPHFFTQSYNADNRWLVVRARYHLARQRWETEFAMTPEVVTFGDDFDTFFQPDGDVVTVGTAGDVSLRSLRLSQRFVAIERGPSVLFASYAYRRDRARFHPADRVETHTKPASVAREFITTRETTISHVHEARIGVEFERRVGRAWRVDASLAVAPTAFARLVTKLPDKYPGRDIVFDAIVVAASGRVSLRREWSSWFVEAGADADRTWNYVADRQFRREGYGLTVRVGVRS